VRALRLSLWPAGVAIGIGAEAASFGWSQPDEWLPDLAVGWTLIACGLIAWSRRPKSRSGALMATTGFAWFAANFASDAALYLHRGPLMHLVLSYPHGRLGGRFDRSAVAIACTRGGMRSSSSIRTGVPPSFRLELAPWRGSPAASVRSPWWCTIRCW
jgi:hypothetical protein